jgi:integrase
MTSRRRERPIKRTNPSGREVWVARYTGRDGKRRSAGTYSRRHEAQDAIDAAHAAEERGVPETVGAYAASWTERHPRSKRTNTTNDGRVRQVLDVELDGRRLGDWQFRDLRRRHALALVTHMLTVQGRATGGAQNVLRALSAMTEDAITDEVADMNWVRGVKVRANDPRATKPKRAPRVLSFEQMHEFAAASGSYEAMIRAFSDCGLRLGEVLGLERADFDGEAFHVRGSAHRGVFTPGDQPTKKHVRTIPLPPSTAELVRAIPVRIDTPLMFPTPSGKLWWERNFYRDVWYPAQEAWAGIDPELERAERRRLVAERGRDFAPHDFRHSWVTHLRAAGIDPADLAAVAGHTVETATARYTHALGRSDDRIRQVIG